ncbi:MAG: hypothetical protein ACK56I_04390, partial [bacterium]
MPDCVSDLCGPLGWLQAQDYESSDTPWQSPMGFPAACLAAPVGPGGRLGAAEVFRESRRPHRGRSGRTGQFRCLPGLLLLRRIEQLVTLGLA